MRTDRLPLARKTTVPPNSERVMSKFVTLTEQTYCLLHYKRAFFVCPVDHFLCLDSFRSTDVSTNFEDFFRSKINSTSVRRQTRRKRPGREKEGIATNGWRNQDKLLYCLTSSFFICDGIVQYLAFEFLCHNFSLSFSTPSKLLNFRTCLILMSPMRNSHLGMSLLINTIHYIFSLSMPSHFFLLSTITLFNSSFNLSHPHSATKTVIHRK